MNRSIEKEVSNVSTQDAIERVHQHSGPYDVFHDGGTLPYLICRG